MRPIRFTKSLATADDNGICLSQTPLAAGNLTLNGVLAAGSPAIATLDTSRQILFTFAADETGRVFTVYGFDKVGGNILTEAVAGTATTAVTTKDFGIITRISVDAATAGALIVGTNGVGASAWYLVDWNLDPTNLVISVDVVGTVNYTVQYTYDNILGEYDGQGNWSNTYPTKIWNDAVLASVTSDGETTYNYAITAWRVLINSGDGTLRVVAVQSGVGGVGS